MKTKWLHITLLMVVTCLILVGLFGCGCGKTPSGETGTESGTESGAPDDQTGGDAVAYYFYDADADEEYFIMLGKGTDKVTFAVKNTVKTGTYRLEGTSLSMSDGNGWSQTASLDGDTVTLTYEGAEYRFLKKIYYTVSFDTAGGSAVAPVTVLNGKTLAGTAAPTREGYVFLGWYKDAAYSESFRVASEPVTSDVKLFARWAEKTAGQTEFTVSFDAGYEGETFAPMQTVGGKLYGAPVPAAREGYTFAGWWVSMSNTADEITFRFEEPTGKTAGTLFTADTTLFALWQKTGAACDDPMVRLEAGAAVWDAVNAAAYTVRVTAPDGSVTVADQRTTGTAFQLTYEQAGTYRVEVTAVDAGGNAVSGTTVRYYVNKALGRVTGLSVVEPAVLVFRGVENAQKYLITVSCGNKDHKHEAFDNGLSCFYDFSTCEMQEGGIRFTVTAVADGYASSTATFTYDRRLDAVSGLAFRNDTLSWNAVPGATSYTVRVGDSTYTVTGTVLDLSALANGSYTASVTPVTKGYNSPAATELALEKATLAAPADLRLVGTRLTWSPVVGASSYEIVLDGRSQTVTEPACDLADAVKWSEGADYTLTVKAVGTSASSAPVSLTVRYNALFPTLTYQGSILSWRPVVGATAYDVQVGDGAVLTVDSGDSFCLIENLEKAGENTLRVRFHNGNYVSAWVETTVFAHAVTLDSQGGSATGTLYKAIGDRLTLPAPEKTGYVFDAWYTVPGGPETNGAAFRETVFTGSGETVLYANYKPRTFTVTCNGGEGTTAATAEVSYNRNYVLAVPASDDPTRAFGGWFSAPYGAGIAYTDAEGNSLAPWTQLEENVTVYAFWVDSVLKYTLVGNGYVVTKGDRIGLVSSVTVPATYRGVPVVEIAGSAFKDCTGLTEINLPNTLTRIAVSTAFEGCTSLKAVSVYAVDGSATARYSSDDGVLFDLGDESARHSAQPVLMPMGRTGAYRIPDGVEIIPRGAFAGSSLSRITIPMSVKEIGIEAFANCTKLTSVIFEEMSTGGKVSTLTVGDRAFMNDEALTSVTLPARLGRISLDRFTVTDGVMDTENVSDAFYGCTALASVRVTGGTKNVYTSVNGMLLSDNGSTLLYAPAGLAVENLTVPDGVTKIAAGAFLNCMDVKGSLEMPGRVAVIGDYAFYGCDGLTSLTFKSGLGNVTVGTGAFCWSGLSSLTFEDGSRVTGLGAGAFENCSGLDGQTLTLPASLESIGDRAFAECGTLEVTILEGKKTLHFGDGVFSGCQIGTLTLPKNVTALPNFLGGLSVERIEVDANNPALATVEGVLYAKGSDGKPVTLLFYPSAKTDLTFTVPATVTAIAEGAFREHYYLEEIVIPAGVTSIGANAFEGAELTKVTFENGSDALTIGAYAFYSSKLTTIELPARTKSVGAYAFAKTSKVTAVSLGGASVIGERAFYSCGNWSGFALEIPASVTEIGESAFRGAVITDLTFAPGSGLTLVSAYAFYEMNDGDSMENDIVIPASVVVIGDHAFDWTKAGFTVEKGSKLTTIGAYAFAHGSMTTFTVPASVESVGAYAFYSNSKLTELLFEDGDKPLTFGTASDGEEGHVINSTGIETLKLPARLTVLENSAFENNYSLTSVTFAEGSRLTTIGNAAFRFGSVTEIVIPASVRNTDRVAIGSEAFYYSGLTKVTFEMGGSADTAPLTLGENAFASNSSLTELVLPARLASFTDASGNTVAPFANGASVFNGCGLTDIRIEGNGTSEYVSKDGVVYTTGLETLVYCPSYKTGTVTIPAEVRKIGEKAFYQCQKLEGVVFASGSQCTEIGAKAFYRCYGLTELVLPDSVGIINEDAFFQCEALVSLTLPAGLTSFDPSIINACEALQNLNVSAASKSFRSVDGVLFTADGKELVYYLPTRADAAYTVPDGVVILRESAFTGNKMLTSVSLPASLTLIDTSAFNSCGALETVEFRKGGTELLVIGRLAFANTALTSVDLPARVASLGDWAFNRTSLSSITFAENSKLVTLGDSVFGSTKLNAVTLPAGIVSIGELTFARCENLMTVTLPEGLKTLGAGTFRGCTALETVNLPASLETVGNGTFEDCRSLKNVVFAAFSKIKTLPNTTFRGCTALESIELPASLTELMGQGESAESNGPGLFAECSSLRHVTFAEGSKLTRIGQSVFDGTPLESITIPNTVSSIGNSAFSGTKLREIVIPRTVTRMGYGVFQACELLTNVRIEGGITTIPDFTFSFCTALTTFTVPASVTEIKSDAFEGCESLRAFVVEDGNTAFLSRDGVVYNKDWTICYFPPAKETYEIPKQVTVLPDGFFSSTSIKSVTVESGNSAFTVADDVLYTADKSRVIFFAVGKTSFTIPAGMTSDDILELLGAAPSLQEILVEEGNPRFRSAFGALYDTEWNLLAVPAARKVFTIPKEVTGLPEGIFRYSGIETVDYEEGGTAPLVLTSERDGVFGRTTTLKTVSLPERTTSVDALTFMSCTSLEVVNLPASLTELVRITSSRYMPFYNCTSLKAVNVDPANTVYRSVGGVLYDMNWNALLYPAGTTELVIPHEVTTVKSLAALKNLVSITFEKDADGNEVPGETLTFASGAFRNLANLKSVELPARATGINAKTFEGCTALTTLTVSAGNAELRTDAYGILYSKNATGWSLIFVPGSVRLTTYVIPEDVTYINAYMFLHTGVTAIDFAGSGEGPELVLADGDYTFNQEIYEWYYAGVFANCKSLQSVRLPARLKTVGSGAFYGCTSLTSVTLDESLTCIGEGAFGQCTALTEFTIPAGVTTIKDNAFGGCTSITKIFIPGTVQTMGWGVFASWTNAQTIYVTFADAESRPDGWSNRWTENATVVYGATSAV